MYDEARKRGYEAHMGINLTSGLFYPGPSVPGTLQVNADAGVISVEMENATLFCVGHIRGIRTAAIGTVDGSPFKWDEGNYDPHGTKVAEGKKRMFLCGLEVATRLAAETQAKDMTESHKDDSRLFKAEEAEKYLTTFRDGHFDEFIAAHTGLDAEQKTKVYELLGHHAVASMCFFLQHCTKLPEDDIKTAVILFHKIRLGHDGKHKSMVLKK